MLYLHEIIDIIGDGQRAYMDSVVERAAHSEREGIARLVGCWRVIGSTHRWPRVVNLWEMEGWDQWAVSLERQFMPGKQDAHLGPWWSKATQWRSGGFDRILEPASYAPTRAQLQQARVTGWVCEHTIIRTTPGARDEYLDVFGGEWPVLAARSGLTLIGAYAVPMRSDEALLIWSAPDFAALCRDWSGRRTDPVWHAWQRRAGGLVRKSVAMWLVPSPRCMLFPSPRA